MLYDNIFIDCVAPGGYVFAHEANKPARILAYVNEINHFFDPIIDFGRGHWVHFSTTGFNVRDNAMRGKTVERTEIKIDGKDITLREAYEMIKAKYEAAQVKDVDPGKLIVSAVEQ